MPYRRSDRLRACCLPLALACVVVMSGCRTPGSLSGAMSGTPDCRAGESCAAVEAGAETPLASARRLAKHADRHPRSSLRDWSDCASTAYAAIVTGDDREASAAMGLATHCTDRFLARALQRESRRWPSGPVRLGDAALRVEHRGLSRHLANDLRLVRASAVPMTMYDGRRFATPGFGVPLATITPRCTDRPECRLQPPEGVFRWATAWFELSAEGAGPPTLVIADPLATGPLRFDGRRVPLAVDTSAHYAIGAGTSPLPRLGWFGLLGGRELGRRAGVYVLGDYDPRKPPLVMLHGLGSNPLIWAKLSNAVWGDPALREHFQVWHVVYQTDAPLLVARRRVQGYLDDAWRLLDPEGDDPAREGMVLVGHSMGGVISRLLCVDSGDALWNAAFTVPPDALPGDAADRRGIIETFRFAPYPGVTRAVFIAAPHRGSPAADRWFGRLSRVLVGTRVAEVQALKRLATQHPEAVRDEVRDSYRRALVNSIVTLQQDQPVRVAGEQLMPVATIPHHSIAGALAGRTPQTDGAVPLASTVLATAESSLVLDAGHDVYRDDAAVAEVLRILHVERIAAHSRARSLPSSPR